MTTESRKTDGAMTLPRMNGFEHEVHATIFSSMLTFACCLVIWFGLGLKSVFGYLVVMRTYLHLFRLSLYGTLKT